MKNNVGNIFQLIIQLFIALSLVWGLESFVNTEDQPGIKTGESIKASPPRQEYYDLNNCTSSKDCNDNCGNFKGLAPLCDPTGTCICDCSKMDEVNKNPIPQNCAASIPSMYHDYCSNKCNQVYKRPFNKICGKPGDYLYCTCLCKRY